MMTRRAVLTAPLVLSACAGMTPPQSRLVSPEGQHALSLSVPGRSTPLQMWLYLPPGYHASTQDWPLLMFLHGSGERGNDINTVRYNGPPRLVREGRHYPCILCSPQLDPNPDEDAEWDVTVLHRLLGVLRQRLRVDPRRITATGLSLGGIGVWTWAATYPEDLAGIAPVCGFGPEQGLCRAQPVPVRAYHGADDDVVPLARDQASVDALRACGGQVSLTVYRGVGHAAWIPAYEDPELVPWLMRQVRA
jgi:predicted peptidase